MQATIDKMSQLPGTSTIKMGQRWDSISFGFIKTSGEMSYLSHVLLY